MEMIVTMNSDNSARPGTRKHDDRYRLLINLTRNTCNMIASESLNYFSILSLIHA